MWNYERRLEFPVNIKEPNADIAQAIISQYGGPDGEMGASMRYLSQRYACPYREVAGVLRDEPDVYEPIKFLRAREVVHFQRFGEANRTDLSKKFR